MQRNYRPASYAVLCATTLSVFIGLGGCGSSDSSTPPGTTALPAAVADAVNRDAPVSSRTVIANNLFGFHILAQVRQTAAPTENVFLSPTSLATALEIAYNGAQGATKDGMAAALQLQTPSADVLNGDNAALQASMLNPDPTVTLNGANSLWLRAGAVKAGFIALNRQFYGSEIGDVAGAPDAVNAWVNGKTGGKITTILPAGDYSHTLFIIANVIYFNASWSRTFDSALTSDAPFTLSDGSRVTVKMMRGEGSYGYFKGARFQALRMPYGTGRLSMLVFLPDADSSLDSLLSGLTLTVWDDWLTRFQNKQGQIGVPRVTSSYGATMNDNLKSLGMDAAFDPTRADFSGLAQVSGQPIYLQAVYHKTFLRIDEQGTEASAATGVVGGTTAAPVFDFHMTLDRPFLCAIRDEKTGVILFLGTIVHP